MFTLWIMLLTGQILLTKICRVIAVHGCIWLNLNLYIHAAEMLQLCVLCKLHVATAVCLVKNKVLDFFGPLCNRGTMWTRAICRRRSGTANGYFNKAHGEDEELWNHYQVLVCVSGRVNECLDNTAVTPQPPLPCRTIGQSVVSGGLSHSTL